MADYQISGQNIFSVQNISLTPDINKGDFKKAIDNLWGPVVEYFSANPPQNIVLVDIGAEISKARTQKDNFEKLTEQPQGKSINIVG